MTKVGLLKFIFLLFIFPAAYGQKVKYKDIFALLSTKQFEQAEPFLKRYLKENDDNPNSFLYMAIIFQEKSGKIDVLKQTSLAISSMDSAIFFYDKANKSIDDREVRRNKEYYQAYSRRDLRTGEFGVKLSDIQFDIQKKIEGLRERIDKVKMLKYYFMLSDTLYRKSHALFLEIRKTAPSERQLYLRADENTIKNLHILASRFDSCTSSFETYKASSANVGNTGYNQVMELSDIIDYEKDGLEMTSFYKDELKVWDYKKFADKSRTIVEKEIFPMRQHLINYDIEINKLRDKLNTDSVSVRSDLTKLIDKLLYDQLKKFDPEPLPMEVFSLKISDLEYRSALLESKVFNDSADVHLMLSLIETELGYLKKLDSIASKLSKEDLDRKAADYSYFITNTYSNLLVLKSYVKALKEYADREKRKKEAALSFRLKAIEWIVDGADSIPLNKQLPQNRFKPLYTMEEKYTVGLHMNDSANADGYLYTVTASRSPDVKVVFPVDKSSFKERKLSTTRALSHADASGQLYFVLVYSEQPNAEKYHATLAKIYRTDGLAWSNNIPLTFIPKELLLRADTGELTIKNETQQIVVDKNGKVLR